jgi:hypothetical protein
MAGPQGSTLTLITNDFRIQTKNKGVIHTYSVDFIVSSGPGASSLTEGVVGEEEEKKGALKAKVAAGTGGPHILETFQKFRIMNMLSEQLRKIFVHQIFVGTNLFSTSAIDD